MSEQVIEPPRPAPIYCRRCSAELLVRDQPAACPACYLQYDPAIRGTFYSHRGSSRWKFWLPGFLLSVTVGTLAYAGCLQTGNMGYALFFAVPVSFGAILGYATRMQTWAIVFTSILAIASVVFALVSLNLAGLFCGFTLGLIFLVPTFFGLVCGIVLRSVLIASGWDHAWYFRWYLWLIAISPLVAQQIETRWWGDDEIAVVRTGLTIDATPEDAWKAIMFYEDVRHAPPWILHLALPQPIRSEGRKDRPGEVVRCFYNCGTIDKRITRVEPQQRLSFDVIETIMRSDNYARLRDGSFEIEPAGPGKSRITLTTRYERKLRPAWIWEPIERKVIHTLHEHVLEGMRRETLAPRPDPPEEPYQPGGHREPKPRVTRRGEPGERR
ncbi:MAG: SRPBCC family protein [Pirellulaceae bacterium]|nr:SRPBCC family protein [Pirellulaceae bacterium]